MTYEGEHAPTRMLELLPGSPVYPLASPATASDTDTDASLLGDVSARFPMRVALALAILLASAVAFSGAFNLRSAHAWRDRSAAAERRLDQAIVAVDASRKDASALESRISSLANEKAHAEDQEAFTAQVAGVTKLVADHLDACVTATDNLVRVARDADRYAPGDVATYSFSVQTACAEARALNRALNDLLA